MHIPPALHHRRFLLLWFGMTISMAGSQMQLSALHWHIRELTGVPDPLALGGIGLARILPVIVFSLIGGAVADSRNRRTILFITQTALALIALALAVLTFTGRIAIWQIYLLTALQAVAMSFDLPARQALVPGLVPGKDLPNAFSLTSIASNTGAIVGPMLSGMVIVSLGLAYTYLFNAISFLAVILALVLIGTVAQEKKQGAAIDLPAIRDGVKFIFTHRMILPTMLLDFVATFFASANTMMPIVARDILHVGELGYGLLSSAQAVGAVLAGLVLSQVRNLRRQGALFLGSVMAFGLATVAFGMAQNLPLAWLALALTGVADSVSTIIRNTIRQLYTPDAMRGRMVSVNQVFFQGGPQLGEVEAGLMAAGFGVPFAIVSGGVGCIVGMGLIVWKWPHLLSYNGDEPLAG
jgi:MFS family permease